VKFPLHSVDDQADCPPLASSIGRPPRQPVEGFFSSDSALPQATNRLIPINECLALFLPRQGTLSSRKLEAGFLEGPPSKR